MEEKFTKSLKQSEEITFLYIKGAKDRTEEFHHFHEIIFLTEGTATFISDNIHVSIKEGTLLVIPAGTYHRLFFDNSLRKHYRCVFHFLDLLEYRELISTSMKEVVLMNADKEIRAIFHRMVTLFDQNYSHETKCILMNSALSMLLYEIGLNTDLKIVSETSDAIVPKTIHYIAKHISEPISVTDIADALNISISTLAHAFREEMNISIYQYILKKRLIMARHKIIEGESATQAAADCGFNDYSSFYRRYKKLFQVAPSSKDQGTL